MYRCVINQGVDSPHCQGAHLSSVAVRIEDSGCRPRPNKYIGVDCQIFVLHTDRRRLKLTPALEYFIRSSYALHAFLTVQMTVCSVGHTSLHHGHDKIEKDRRVKYQNQVPVMRNCVTSGQHLVYHNVTNGALSPPKWTVTGVQPLQTIPYAL
jgi:hypothetical protein